MQQNSDLLFKIHSDLRLLTQQIESAFPRDDNDEVDYMGHRQYHKDKNAENKDYKASRATIITNLITWAVIGGLTLVATVLGEAYVIPVFKSLMSSH